MQTAGPPRPMFQQPPQRPLGPPGGPNMGPPRPPMNGFNGPPMQNNNVKMPPGPPGPYGPPGGQVPKFAGPPSGPPTNGHFPPRPPGAPNSAAPPGGPPSGYQAPTSLGAPQPPSQSQQSPTNMGPPPGPQMSQNRPGMPPGMPQQSMPGMPPSSQQNMPGMPPMSQPNVPGMAPPMSQPSNMPTMSQPGMPPMSQPGMPPQTSMPGMPPMSQPSQTSMPGVPPMSQPGMPPMSQPGMPPMSQPGMPPRPGMPPPSNSGIPGMPPTQLHSMPPMSQPGMPPMSQPGMPPMGQPGMPPMSQPGMPPRPGMPPSQHGMPPRPGMPPTGPGMTPGMAPGMGPGAAPSAGRRTLDPDQMPSPIQVMEEDQKSNGGYFDTREKGHPPPLVTTKYITRDYGNASPRLIRSTMYYVPSSEDMRKQSGVPFGLVISPLAEPGPDELEAPVTDFGPSGPVRCIRCKAYICSFMQFIDGGRRFQCPFCKATTEVPQEYFNHLDHNGKRVDHYQRAELCLGTYECVATKDYCREGVEPKVPAILFAIDVSYPMIKEGIVQMICSNMKEMLKHLPRDMNCDKERMRVGFMTYDSKINFYNVKGALTQPQMMTVGDVNDMFVPLVDGLMCTVEESEAVIDSLMEQIPGMFSETRETETILGPVIQAGKEAFKAANCAGKLIVFHHNLPVAEAPGKLKNRDDRKVLGKDTEKTVLTPQNKMYNNFGQECVANGCSVDLFLFNNAYIDVATLSQVCRLSGGQLYKYTYFQPDLDGERFLADLKHNLSRPVVFDAIMRVRTSTGVRPVEFFGSFFMANTTDTELASINSDMAIACEIKYDDKITEEDGVYIQAAMLFTSCSGQRRLRVINLSLNTGSSMAEMYRNCELDTLVNFTAKQSISRLMETNPKTVKENLISNCAQILACYRKNCASPSSAGQLILPECMKLLPLYTNCLLKSDAISGGADVGCDDRAFLMSAVGSMDVVTSVAFFYPRLFPIHDLKDDQMPKPVRCTIEKITDDGIYLLENGLYLFMYIGLAADPTWIQEVFGVQTAAQIDIDKTRLQDRDTPASQRVRKIIDHIRGERKRYFMRLVLVRQRDKLDILFRHYLCEDRAAPGASGASVDNFSYVDFLCHMHKEIRALLG